MVTDIDIATGLPALPEGYFWRVQHRRQYGDTVYGTILLNLDKTRLQVQLIHKYLKTRPDARRSQNWYGKRVWKTVTLEDQVEDSLFTEDALGTNPIAIQNAANRIMKLWEKAKERDALVGDYPPKSLNI